MRIYMRDVLDQSVPPLKGEEGEAARARAAAGVAAVKRARVLKALREIEENRRRQELRPKRKRDPFERLVAGGGLSDRAIRAAEEIEMVHACDLGLYQVAAELGTVIRVSGSSRIPGLKRMQAIRLRYLPWRDALYRGRSTLGSRGPGAYGVTIALVVNHAPMRLAERRGRVCTGTGPELVASALDLYGTIASW